MGKATRDRSWEQLKEKIKETNIEITDEDLHHEEGQEDAMYARLAQKLHKSKQEVKNWIESISQNKNIAG